MLSPLGLLATGTAFGEWGMDELREDWFIPAGLQQFAECVGLCLFQITLFRLHRYLFHAAGGYILSALLGAGLVADTDFTGAVLGVDYD